MQYASFYQYFLSTNNLIGFLEVQAFMLFLVTMTLRCCIIKLELEIYLFSGALAEISYQSLIASLN